MPNITLIVNKKWYGYEKSSNLTLRHKLKLRNNAYFCATLHIKRTEQQLYYLRRFWISCLGPLGFSQPSTLKLFGIPIFWLSAPDEDHFRNASTFDIYILIKVNSKFLNMFLTIVISIMIDIFDWISFLFQWEQYRWEQVSVWYKLNAVLGNLFCKKKGR
jgi:hypothetical protein